MISVQPLEMKPSLKKNVPNPVQILFKKVSRNQNQVLFRYRKTRRLYLFACQDYHFLTELNWLLPPFLYIYTTFLKACSSSVRTLPGRRIVFTAASKTAVQDRGRDFLQKGE